MAEVVRRCPTGALHYRLLAEEPEEPTHPAIVTADPQGPLLVRTAARTGRPRLTGAPVGWYLVVALLHILWTPPGRSRVADLPLTATQAQWALIQLGRVPQPTQAQTHLFTMINGGLLLLDALLGVAVLRGRWRQALALEHGPAGPRPPLHS